MAFASLRSAGLSFQPESRSRPGAGPGARRKRLAAQSLTLSVNRLRPHVVRHLVMLCHPKLQRMDPEQLAYALKNLVDGNAGQRRTRLRAARRLLEELQPWTRYIAAALEDSLQH